MLVATIYDVARVAGVSITTVSHVLNNTRRVNAETKERVLQAVEQLGYRPSFLARALVRQETETIALIVPDNVNPFFAEMARGIENYGFAAGHNVILCNSDNDIQKELAYLDMLISKRVDGVIYMTGYTHTEKLEALLAHHIPIVTLDRDYAGIDAILIDNVYGGYEATKHLLSLGHRRIACVAGPETECAIATGSVGRVDGYRQALQDAGAAYDPAFVCSGNYTFDSGREAARGLMRLAPRPTAIFACNDVMAIGAISYLDEEGIDVPGEVSVVGFDDVTLARFYSPPLTTVATPILEIGQRLCQMLLDRINARLPAETQRVTVRGELRVRCSTAPVVEP